MPPKKSTPLQAVVLCDSYESRFRPLTLCKPRCLLPLANRPLIDYTLEFLVSTEVKEVFLLCCNHADQLASYIKTSPYASTNNAPYKTVCIEMQGTRSVGDALREVDARGIIKGDFILISGDVVSNVDFTSIWNLHCERKRNDKDLIMSIILRQAAVNHRTRAHDTGVFVLESANNRLIGYTPLSKHRKSLEIEAGDLLGSEKGLTLRNDLIDCQIDICTQDVPALFTENFDYEHLRCDFVKGVLTSDLLGKTIYCHIVEKGYAARVESLKTYDAVSRDIISRYAYPLLIDSDSYYQGHVYKGQGVVLSQSSSIANHSAIGAQSRVGAGSTVSNSIIGANCSIGSNVSISDSYIWDNVTIGDGATLSKCIVASNASIGEGCVLKPNTIVSFDYILDSNQVCKGEKLYNGSEAMDEYGESSDEEKFYSTLTPAFSELDLSDHSIVSVRHKIRAKTGRSLSTTSAISAATEEDEGEDFFKEAVASINRSILDKHSQDVAILELNTLRMTMNAPHEKVQEAVVASLIGHACHISTQTNVKDAVTSVFQTWSPLIKRITFDAEAEVRLASYLENECAKVLSGDKMLFYALSSLYDTDVLSEDAALAWWQTPAIGPSQTRSVVSQWIQWLLNAEEESD